MKNIFKFQDKFISDEDIVDILKSLGLKKDDDVCVHSELFKIGTLALSKNDFLQSIIKCFFDVIGDEGTLIMPTFTYSFCKNEDYDKKNSKSTMGILSEFFRKQKAVFRTNDPIFSFAIKGKRVKEYLQDTKTCFGQNCVYDILRKNNGKLILFGNELKGLTYAHYLEEKFQVPYRFYKEFSGNIIYEDGKVELKKIKYYVRYLDRRSIHSSEKNNEILKEQNQFFMRKLGNGELCLFDTQNFHDIIKEALKYDIFAMLVK